MYFGYLKILLSIAYIVVCIYYLNKVFEMEEKRNERTVSFLGKFDEELWTKFKNKLYPYGYSLKDVVEDLIKVFVGESDKANPEVLKELQKEIEKIGGSK